MGAADVIENPASGERIVFSQTSSDLLVMRAVWPRRGHRTIEHAHPSMQERFTVVAGSVALRIADREVWLEEGESVVAPAGMPHLAWNPTSGPVEVCMEMRPAARWEQFTRRLFAGEDPGVLLREYAQEIVLA